MSNFRDFDFNLFRSMEVFNAVVETHHITQAVKLLGITQSAASQHVNNLEKALAAELIDRSVRPVRITLAGIALHQHSQNIFTEIEELKKMSGGSMVVSPPFFALPYYPPLPLP